jgi:hypothetical protein
MKKINNNRRQWALLLMLLVWLPINVFAQSDQFEMVIEKTDGTELAFLITNDFPVLQYQYGGENGINTLDIQHPNGLSTIPCPEIKRLYTREVDNTGIKGVTYALEEQMYDISGRQLNLKRELLSKGIYIKNGKKYIVK